MLLRILAVISSMVLFSTLSFADDMNSTSSTFPTPTATDGFYKPSVGLLVGGAEGEGALKSGVEYGIDASYQPYIPFGLGLELSSVTADRADFADENFTRTKLMVKGTYNLGGTIPVIKDTYVGLGLGPMLESLGSSDNLYVGLMPLAGFDIPLASKTKDYMSAGFAARYLISSSGAPNTFSLNGTVKYWF